MPNHLASLQPFELEVFISGYAISFKNRESMSRAQRAFIRVAKGMPPASLIRP